MMQKMEIKLTSLSELRSLDSSALQPDFKYLVEQFDLPAHRIPVQFLNGGLEGSHRQVGEQLPGNFLTAPGRSPFRGVDHGERKFWIVFPFSNRGKNLQLLILDFQFGLIKLSRLVSGLNAVPAFNFRLLQQFCDRTVTNFRQPVVRGWCLAVHCPGAWTGRGHCRGRSFSLKTTKNPFLVGCIGKLIETHVGNRQIVRNIP